MNCSYPNHMLLYFLIDITHPVLLFSGQVRTEQTLLLPIESRRSKHALFQMVTGVHIPTFLSRSRIAKLDCHTKQKVFKPHKMIEMLLPVQQVATLPRFPFYLVRKGLTVCRKSLYEVQLTD